MIEIVLEKIHIDVIIGVYPHEKGRPQPLYITVALNLESDSSATSDNLSDTCDYDQVITCIDDVATLKPFELIEAFGYAVKTRVEALENVKSARVTVEKPEAVPRAAMTRVTVS